jgi:hypothetical protein
MGVVVQSGSAHVRGRRVLEQVFFDGVAVEPGDGAQPSGDGRPGPPGSFPVPAEAFDVRTSRGEQMQPVLRAQDVYWRRSRV